MELTVVRHLQRSPVLFIDIAAQYMPAVAAHDETEKYHARRVESQPATHIPREVLDRQTELTQGAYDPFRSSAQKVVKDGPIPNFQGSQSKKVHFLVDRPKTPKVGPVLLAEVCHVALPPNSMAQD